MLLLLGLLLTMRESLAAEKVQVRALEIRVRFGQSPRLSADAWNYWTEDLCVGDAEYIVDRRELHRGRPLFLYRHSSGLGGNAKIGIGLLNSIRTAYGSKPTIGLCISGPTIVSPSECGDEATFADFKRTTHSFDLLTDPESDYEQPKPQIILAKTVVLKTKLGAQRPDFQVWASASSYAGQLSEFPYYASGLYGSDPELLGLIIEQMSAAYPNESGIALCVLKDRILLPESCE